MKQLRLFPEHSFIIGSNVLIISDHLKTLTGKPVPAQTAGIVTALDPISVWTYTCGNIYSVNVKHLEHL